MRRRRMTAVTVAIALATIMSVTGAGLAPATSIAFPLDPTWAAGQPVPGLLRLQLDDLPAFASFVRVLPDGSSYVALTGVAADTGYVDTRKGIVKLRPDGTLDPTFNAAGATPGIVDFVPGNGIVDIAVDHHGRLLVAGTSSVTRLRTDGQPDPAFVSTCINPCVPGQGEPPGHSPTGSVFVYNRVYDLEVLDDDSVIVESSSEINQNPHVMYVTKLTSTGDRDLTFSPTAPVPGIVTIDDYGPASLAPQVDGSIVLTALTLPARLHRITADGHLDTTYGTAGTAHLPGAANDELIWQSTPIGPDLLIGLAHSSPPAPASLLRIHTDGSTDTTYADNGRLDLTLLGASVSFGPFFVLDDGRALLEIRGPQSTAIVRLTADGRLDASFNPNSTAPGWLTINPAEDPGHSHSLSSVAEAANGKLIGAGSRYLTGTTPNDPIAEVYRFDGYPGPPQPIAPYPITSPSTPPAAGPSLNAPATATRQAVRLIQS